MEMASEQDLKRITDRVKTGRSMEQIAQDVLALQTADKFRLAGMLLDIGKPQQAEAVGTRACQEIQLAMLFGKKR